MQETKNYCFPKSLQSQTAVITGAATGIGAGVAYEMALRGAKVVVNHLHQGAEAEQLIECITEAGGHATAIDADITDAAQVESLIRKAVEAFGRLDIMVANAGVQADAPALEMTLEQWDKAMNVDLRGAFICAREAARIFVRQGVSKNISCAAGKIICMLSVHDRIPWMGHTNYAAAKAGANMMMQTLAQEWAGLGIRVVGISPGAIRTDINRSVWENDRSRESLLSLIPYRRMGTVGDVANVAAWLASDEADYITGSTIYVDGGMMLYPGFIGNG